MATTLAQLRLLCQQESDNVNQTFVSDAEWNSYINRSYLELYGLVVQSFGDDYFVQTPSTGFTVATDGVNQFFALPSDFFKLLGVDLQLNSAQWVALREFNFNERNLFQWSGSNIPPAGQTLRLFYVPRATALSADSDSVDGVNGWEEYIVVDAAMKALAKEESDISPLVLRKQALLSRLASEIENRNASGSGRVTDVYQPTGIGMRYRLNGSKLWLIGGTALGWPADGWGGEMLW